MLGYMYVRTIKKKLFSALICKLFFKVHVSLVFILFWRTYTRE